MKPAVGDLIRFDPESSQRDLSTVIWRVIETSVDAGGFQRFTIEPVFGLFNVNKRFANRTININNSIQLVTLETLGLEYMEFASFIRREVGC